jgi:hypothetical protein
MRTRSFGLAAAALAVISVRSLAQHKDQHPQLIVSSGGVEFYVQRSEPGLGSQSVMWGVFNKTNDTLDLEFDKTYWTTNNRSLGTKHGTLTLKPHQEKRGGPFLGDDLDLDDDFFWGADGQLAKGEYIGRVAAKFTAVIRRDTPIATRPSSPSPLSTPSNSSTSSSSSGNAGSRTGSNTDRTKPSSASGGPEPLRPADGSTATSSGSTSTGSTSGGATSGASTSGASSSGSSGAAPTSDLAKSLTAAAMTDVGSGRMRTEVSIDVGMPSYAANTTIGSKDGEGVVMMAGLRHLIALGPTNHFRIEMRGTGSWGFTQTGFLSALFDTTGKTGLATDYLSTEQNVFQGVTQLWIYNLGIGVIGDYRVLSSSNKDDAKFSQSQLTVMPMISLGTERDKSGYFVISGYSNAGLNPDNAVNGGSLEIAAGMLHGQVDVIDRMIKDKTSAISHDTHVRVMGGVRLPF